MTLNEMLAPVETEPFEPAVYDTLAQILEAEQEMDHA